MKTLAIVAFLSLFSANALANGCSSIKDIAGLDSVEKQAMVVACEQKKLEAAAVPAVSEVSKVAEVLNKDTMSEISEIAKVAGQTVKEVAAELNVAVNDFIKTPVGMLTAGLAVWYVAGDTIEGVFEGLWDIAAGITVILLGTYFYKKFVLYATLESHTEKTVKNIFGTEKQVRVPEYRTWKDLNFESGEDAPILLLTLAWIGSVIAGIVFIF